MQVTSKETVAARPFDLDELIEICLGDLAFVELLLRTFQRDSEAHLERICRYTSQGDRGAASRAAHSLRGSAAIATAKAVQRVATKIQAAGDQGSIGQLYELVEDLTREIGYCRDFLSRRSRK